MPAGPIFLHSGFRSGSTWFWNRFRECAGAYGFCEPLNVKLAFLTPEKIESDRPDAWPSGHPPMRPYTEEYRPLLLPGGGVRLYDPRFGVETCYQTGDDPALERYIASLLSLARDRGKAAVLGFCCSLGRVAWFRRFAGVRNVVTWRNPRDQWVSTHAQWVRHGNFSFEVHSLLATYIARLSPRLAPLFQDLGPIPSPTDLNPSMSLFAEPSGTALRFRAFLRVFTLDTLISVQQADLLVEFDRLNEPGPYRREITERLRDWSGFADLDFEDCRLPHHPFDADADYPSLLRAEAEFLEEFARTDRAADFPTSLPFLRERFSELIAISS